MKKLFTAIFLAVMLSGSVSAQNICDSITSHLVEHPFGFFVTDSISLKFYYEGKTLIQNPVVSVVLDDTSEVAVRGTSTISHISDDDDTVTFPALKVTFKTQKKGVNTTGKVRLYTPGFSPPMDCEFYTQFYIHRPNTCDSIKVPVHEVYTNKPNDTVVFSVVYSGNNPVNYPKFTLLLDDTTDFKSDTEHQYFALADSSIMPFHLIHKTSHIPDFLYGRIIMEDGLGNGNDSCVMAVVIRFNKSNAIDPVKKDEGFKFYPNPVLNSAINVSAPEKGKIQILSMLGQELLNCNVYQGLNKINLNLQNGRYIIVFITPTERRKGILVVP